MCSVKCEVASAMSHIHCSFMSDRTGGGSLSSVSEFCCTGLAPELEFPDNLYVIAWS